MVWKKWIAGFNVIFLLLFLFVPLNEVYADNESIDWDQEIKKAANFFPTKEEILNVPTDLIDIYEVEIYPPIGLKDPGETTKLDSTHLGGYLEKNYAVRGYVFLTPEQAKKLSSNTASWGNVTTADQLLGTASENKNIKYKATDGGFIKIYVGNENIKEYFPRDMIDWMNLDDLEKVKLADGITGVFDDGNLCFKKGKYLVEVLYSTARDYKSDEENFKNTRDATIYVANLVARKIPGTTEQFAEKKDFEITIEAGKEGYEKWTDKITVKGYEPSKININGTVKDENKQPIAGAVVTLPKFNVTAKTDNKGRYSLKTEASGSKSFTIQYDINLKKKLSVNTINLEVSPGILPVPGSAILKAVVTDNSGKPVEGAKVEISYLENISFVTLDNNGGITGKNGEFITAINIDKPSLENYPDMNAFPLSLPLEIKVFDQESGSNILTKQFTYPFNLAMIKGATLGPDMKPREEKSPLKLVVNSWRELPIIGARSNEKGEFYLLVPMSDPNMPSLTRLLTTSDLQLMWGEKESPELIYPLKEKLSAGKAVDVGGIDILTPEEHETRIKNLVGEFINSMPLKKEAKSLLLKELSNVVFSDGSTKEVPVYKKNRISSGGTISIPGKKEEYWAKCLVNAEDPPYTIMLHELGHFMHLALVEKNYYTSVIYNKMVGTMHTTWTMPVPSGVSGWVAPDTQKMFTSFSESAADFFAYLAWEYWQKHHPEIKDSVFFNRGYMAEFDNDNKAMEAVSKYLGSQVEGVQTRFLRVFYGNDCIHFPATVYSDYIATMLQYKENPDNWEGWIYRVPARTIQQWIYAKSNHPSAVGVKVAGDVYNIASRYRMFKGIDPVPTATPASEDGNSEIKHNGEIINFKEFPVAEIEFGKELEVIKGTINVDISSVNEQRFLYLNKGTSIVIRDRAVVEVRKGIVGLKGKVTLKTPKAEVTPTGTAVFVEVADDGTTIARVVAGEAVVRAGGTEQSLQAGQKVEVGSNGTLGKIEDFDIETYIKQYLSAPENPFEGGMPPTGLWIVKFIGDVVYYALMVLPYLIIAAMLYVFWRLVKRFGIKKTMIFIIILIVIVVAFVYLYMRLFPPLIQDTF